MLSPVVAAKKLGRRRPKPAAADFRHWLVIARYTVFTDL
jgi:hypothetical protein